MSESMVEWASAVEAFGIERGEMVALVGGGGKTALRDRLAADARARGWRVVVTTTTKTGPPEGIGPQGRIIIEEDAARRAEAARAALDRDGYAFVVSAQRGDGRWVGVEPGWPERVRGAVDLVVVEADGSRKKPLKAPAAHEPVIPPSATRVVAVVGAEAIGAPIGPGLVHRMELFLEATGMREGDLLSPAALAAFILSPGGYRKSVPPAARFQVFINKVSLARAGAVEALAAALRPAAAVMGEARERRFTHGEFKIDFADGKIPGGGVSTA
jgi:probable selenium-dependent hydroxylase accessory protein YqeC